MARVHDSIAKIGKFWCVIATCSLIREGERHAAFLNPLPFEVSVITVLATNPIRSYILTFLKLPLSDCHRRPYRF